MILGAIGARSKHLRFFQQALDLLPPGQRIGPVCAFDAPEQLPALTDFEVCVSAEEVITHSDAVLLLLREGYLHAALAELALKQGKAVFVDKPFACNVAQARAMADLSHKTGTPCTGGSTICFTPQVHELCAALPRCPEYTLTYQADPFSPFGGWFFYGSHLTDLCTCLFGGGFHAVQARCENSVVTADVLYPDFTVHLRSTPGVQPPILLADRTYLLDDQGCYPAGMKHFLSVIKKETPGCAERLVSSVKLMEAIIAGLRG